MILRLASGSVTPASASKKRSAAFTWTRSMWNWRRKVSSTCSLSLARMRPVSTYTQVSWSPMALWTRAAATAESTPPDRAHSTGDGPDLGPHGGHLALDDRGVGPRRGAVADVVEEALEQVATVLGVDDLGVELHAEDAPLGVVEGGHGRVGAAGRGHEPVGHRGDGVAVAHPHLGRPGPVGEERRRAGDGERGAPVLAPAGAGHLAAELLGEQLGAVADAQDGDPEVVDGRVDRGRRVSLTDLGPPDRMIPAGRRAARSAAAAVCGTISE